MDEKIKQLSNTIVNYSIKVKKNDRVLITSITDKPYPLIKALIKDITDNGGIPFVQINNPGIESYLLKTTTDKRIEQIKIHEKQKVDNYDAFINIRYTTNEYENIDVDPEIKKKRNIATNEIDTIRINERRWVLLNYPSEVDAYKAHKNTDEYFEYAIDVMNVDYKAMENDVKSLVELMERTDKVRIIGPNTDINFSLKGMKAVPCCGKCNIPDGEVYTAPIKDSINGIITYNAPSIYHGNTYTNVRLTFKDGKVIEATADNDVEKLNEIFDTDEGSRYVGEFSIGLNPRILNPMGDILYDEKIMGSIHFTPGSSYRDTYNGNDSSIHWDLVMIGREEYGGSEIYFDDVLIRKDGIFTIPELEHLNYKIK